MEYNNSYNNNRTGGMVTMYEETGSRMRGQDYADGYDSSNSRNNNRRDYRQGRSNSPNHRRNSRGRERSRSPHQFHERVYDDFAARDFNNDYTERPGGGGHGYRGDERGDNARGGYERDAPRDTPRDTPRDYRETYNERDNRHGDRDRRGQRYRESRDDRSTSRERYRDNARDSNRDGNRDNRDSNRDNNRDNIRDNRDNSRDNNRDSNRDNRDSNRQNNRENSRYDRDDDYHSDRSRRRSTTRENDYLREDDLRTDTIMPPSSTIILQNVGPECTELKIETHLKLNGLNSRNVAVIRERSGENKGYAFVEFDDINTAEKWLKVTKRAITIDGRSVQLNFSKSRKNDPTNIPDWYCIKCNVLNFGSRKRHDKKATCYQCGALQTDSDYRTNEVPKNNINDNKDLSNPGEVAKVEPCNVLMVRGMDFSTTEEMIRTAIGGCTTRPIFDVRLIRDKVTDMSRGFAFIEMGSVPDASDLLQTIVKSDPPFDIVGRRITIGYARHGYNAPLSGKKGKSGLVSKQMAAENAVAQASSAKATSEYSQSVADSYASAVLAGKNVTNATSVALSTANAGVAASSGSAIPSSYTYDPVSGYYYDSSTSLYYDPNTGYYYNSTSSKWLFWNGSRYQAVNQDGTPVTPTSAQPAVTSASTTTECTVVTATGEALTEEQRKAINDDKDKVAVSFQKPKTARKIAKDMERWAKKMNTATEARKIAVKQAQEELKLLAQKEEELRQQILQEVKVTGITLPEVSAPPKDNIRSLFVPDNDDEGSVLKLGSALAAPPSQKPKATTSVIAADIPEDDDFVDESKFVDVSKIACLLCKRQFPSKDVLTKHLQMSQLHKDNLEKYKKSKQVT